MPRFRQKPSSRRAPSPTAKQLITGPTIASDIKYGRRTTHLLPVKPSHHLRRFHDGQRLSLKAYVGGPTEAHVHVTGAERVPLRDVDYATVRELGYVRVDEFRAAWVKDHDQAWLESTDAELLVDAMLERFDRRHAHRDVWVIRFALDRMQPPRFMADGGRDRGSFRKRPDGRWQYVESAENAEADRGYTSVLSLSVDQEAPDALTDEEWKAHVYDNRDLSHEQWVALGRLESIAARAQVRADRGRNMRRRAA
jgi:hypothetical protein